MLEAIILITSIILSLITGLLVYSRNPKSVVNRLYGLLTVTIIAFSVSNSLSLGTNRSLLFVRLVMALASSVATLLYFLVVSLSARVKLYRYEKVGIWLSILIIFLDFTPLVFSGLSHDTNPTPIPNYLAPLFLIHLFIFFGASLILLLRRIRHTAGVNRLQSIYLFVGALPMLIIAPITGFILPVVFRNSTLVFLSPVYGVFFVCLIGYAIVKHRLFDVRIMVARSIGYVATIIVLASLYGFIVFGIAKYIFHVHISTLTQVFLALSTGFAGLVFPIIKKHFDKFTNRLFYRDAYEPQELFDRLNKVLVSSLDTQFLMMQSVSILETALKPDYMLIGLKDGENGQRIFGSRKVDFDQKTIMQVRKLTPQVHHKVIVADYIENAKYMELKELMLANNVAVIVRLSQDVRKNEDGLGYIVLGARKSGNPYTQQDVRVLDTVANELIIAIQNALHFEEIQNFNKTLQTRVDEATRKLRSTNARLRELDESKDDFISMASHQLRTPLTSVKGYLSMVLEGDAGKLTATQTQMLKQSFASAQRTVYIISDLLNVSRLKTGKFIIDATPTDLSRVVQEEVDQLKETASSRHVDLLYDKPDNFPELMLDETKTRQVIMNFIDNAIYYTPANGNIKVRLVDSPTTIELRVEDDGIGVPKVEQHHLFTKFYRARNAQRARPDGTGLGLFMAKKVVMSQGGAIIFESKEGVGSTFGFVFSKSELKVVPVAPSPSKPRAKAKVVSK